MQEEFVSLSFAHGRDHSAAYHLLQRKMLKARECLDSRAVDITLTHLIRLR